MLAQSLHRCTSPASVAASAVRSVAEATRQTVVVVLEHGLTVVTRNVRHFDPSGATILNPLE